MLLWHAASRPHHALVHNFDCPMDSYCGVLTSKTHCERLVAITGGGHLKGHGGHQQALDY